ncbi:BppU family phage baseplate upper protein [Staphylococcus pettenkoferi]|uniref:BppU family phage baseplate upper protein n=1 Tax=Staphylococcus pettenkoferi TaxID=170573 RepID=UPI00247FD9A6|nr:BppU family phage baseplate upper protein [Staphylococcus pettenkoferi]MDH9616854.1 BppU family phage baseplate upper protein [Staphylococcus pettenkoferi]
MDGMYKEAKLLLHDEPYLRPISDQGIGFYNMDVNTAVLTFQVKRKDFPLSLSPVNTNIYAYFISDNGSTTGKVDVDFIDPLNGIIRITLDEQFLKASTDTNVRGQIYIKAIGKKDTVVLNEFTFRVKDALINQIDGDIKVSYIREIDDLIDDFKSKMAEAFKTLTDIEDVKSEFADFAKAQIEQLQVQIEDMTSEFKEVSSQTKIEITDQVNSIQNQVNEALQKLEEGTATVVTLDELNEKLQGYPTNETLQSLDNKKLNISDLPKNIQALDDLDQIIQDKVAEHIEKTVTQKYEFTDENGYIPRIDNLNMKTMSGISKSGWYYIYSPLNSPDSDNQSGYLQVIARSSTYIKVLFMPYNRHKIYSRNKMGSTTGWGQWRDITSQYSIPSKSDEQEDFDELEYIDEEDDEIIEEDPNNV